MALVLRDGRWGLSRIIVEEDGGFAVAAMRERLGAGVQAFYPPMTAAKDGYTLPFALVRIEGAVGSTDADTRLIPDRLLSATLGDLTALQRQRLRDEFEEWLSGYEYDDWDGQRITKAAFSAAGYTLSTPLRRVFLDAFAHLGHSDYRAKPAVFESHNTEYLDNFSTDPTSRWTTLSGTVFAWDSANNELDFNTTVGFSALYSANDPGSIVHEAQITAKEATTAAVRSWYAAVRGYTTNQDCYTLFSNGDDIFPLGRWNAASRTALTTFSVTERNADDFFTWRVAAEGAAGANVALSLWYSRHGTTKPSDPGWIGVDNSPSFTYTDTAVDRLDDSTHLLGGIGGRLHATTDTNTRASFFKVRAISDRGGVPVEQSPLSYYYRTLLGT